MAQRNALALVLSRRDVSNEIAPSCTGHLGVNMLVFDESQSPILIARWSGETTQDDVDQFYEWIDEHARRARARHIRLALINDSHVQKTNPDLRRQLVERGKKLQVEDTITTWVVLNNIFVRGIFTAVQWIDPSTRTTRVAATFEQALREAKAHFKISA